LARHVAAAIEAKLPKPRSPSGASRSQIPERVDGFLPAEKHFSQSRLVSGATRLQPITMLTGQAVGAIAAVAVKGGVQPRYVSVLKVQIALLDAGCTLIQRWRSDIPCRTSLWKAAQLLSLYQVMDCPGPITKDERPLGVAHPWGATDPLTVTKFQSALAKLCELESHQSDVPALPHREAISVEKLRRVLEDLDPAWGVALDGLSLEQGARLSRGEFAGVAARILLQPVS